jgi:hypothetical protein
MTDGAPTTRAVVRRFSLGSGPLKRRSDRLQYLARLLLVVLLLLAAPVGVAVGTAVYSQGRADAAAEASGRHRTTAQLLEDASSAYPAAENGGWQPPRARVSWTVRSSATREAVVDVPAGARAGSSTRIWVDATGEVSPAPLSAGDAVGEGVALGIVAFIAFTVVTVLGYEAFRLLLERSRSRRWAAEWAAVEPGWTGTVAED